MAAIFSSASRLLMRKSLNSPVVSRQMSAGGHAEDGWKMWRNMFFVVGVPVIILGHVNAFAGMSEEHARPEFIPYDHLRIRTKKFPWGDGNHSFIHNPHVNALPDGYEEEH